MKLKGSNWTRLPPTARIKVGDRPIYVGGILGGSFPKGWCVINMKVGESGYFGVARKRSKAKH